MINSHFTRKIPTQAKWMFLLVILPLYMYCGSLIGTAILKFVMDTFSLNWDLPTINCYLNVIVDLGMLLIVGWMLKDTMIEQLRDFKKDIKGHLLYGCVIGTVLIYVVGIIGGLITMLLGGASTSENQELIQSITNVHPLLMSLTTVILAPLLEEMIFRGIVFGWLYELDSRLAHVISGFIFGFVHVMVAVLSGNIGEWVQIFSYFFMGVVLSYLYEKRNNIYVPVLTHTMNNLISMIIILL